MEELRQREANLTALQAIGPRKKPRLDGPGNSGDVSVFKESQVENNQILNVMNILNCTKKISIFISF